MKQIELMPHRGFPFLFQQVEGGVELAHNEQIEVGDQMYVDKWNGALGRTIRILYPVTEIVASRPAKGEWGGVETPTWFRLKLGNPISNG